MSMNHIVSLWLIEKFYDMGGFDVLLDIVGCDKVPFNLLSFIPIKAVKRLREDRRLAFMEKYKTAIVQRVRGISDADIRVLDKE
jgi:hypothetical protein